MMENLYPIQLLDTISLLSEAFSPFSVIIQGWRVLHAWLLETIGADLLLLLAFFCAGYCLFNPTCVALASWYTDAKVTKQVSELKTTVGSAPPPSISAVSNKDAEKETFGGESDEERSQSMCSESSQCSGDFAVLQGDAYRQACLPGQRRKRQAMRKALTAHPPKLSQGCTTAILRNLPKSCTPHDFLACLHECGYFGQIDLVYVPIDFKHTNSNFGFAIVNFNTHSACVNFAMEFHSMYACDKFIDSEDQNLLVVTQALIQGCEVNIRRLQQSPVLSRLMRYPCWLPLKVDAGGLAMPVEARHATRSSRRRNLK
jgi:hypothetical protein